MQNKLRRLQLILDSEVEFFNLEFHRFFFQIVNARKTARFKIKEMEWYFGNITRQEAEELLVTCSRDAFLIRNSSIEGSYAVSLYEQATQ